MKRFVLAHSEARRRALETVRLAPEGYEVVVKPPTRNGEQNRKFHAICADLARSKLPWMGKPRDAAAWKVLLVSGHAMATNEGVDIVPGIGGEFVNLRESTALMSKSRSSSLIEYSLAFCAMHDIETEEATA